MNAPRGTTWGGPAQAPSLAPARRTKTAPADIDPVIAYVRSIDIDDAQQNPPPLQMLRERLGMGVQEWTDFLETLKTDKLPVKAITPSARVVKPNNAAETHRAARLVFPSGQWSAISTRLGLPRVAIAQFNLKDAWNTFVRDERNLSKEDGAYLVRPSGNFTKEASLGILLHYPTFRTFTPRDREIADRHNPCTRLLLKKGLNPLRHDGIVWYDSYTRRESKNAACDPPYRARS